MGKPTPPSPSGAELLALGAGLATCVVLPLLAGMWLQDRLNLKPLGIIAGLAIGIVAATATLFVRLKRYW